MLLSFERPAASPAGAFSADLENCTALPTGVPAQAAGANTGITGPNRIRKEPEKA